MYELYAARMQRDASVGVGALGAIFKVALDGAADGGELASYLVVSACEQLHLNKVIHARGGLYLVA